MRIPGRIAILGSLAGAAIAVISASGVLAAPPTPASAVTAAPAIIRACVSELAAAKANPGVETLRAAGDCEIARRMTTLDTLTAAISSAKALAPSDAAALNTEIAATRTGLKSLQASIDAESSLDALKTDIRQIATDYRVYLLVAPKVHLVIAAERVVALQSSFAQISTRLDAAIAKAKAAGKDVSAAQGYVDDMNAKVGQAESLATPLPAQLLPLTPAQYNAGTAGPVLDNARASLVKARDLLRQARADAKAARDALAGLR